MNRTSLFFAFLAFSLIGMNAAHAELICGQIQSINPSNNSITLVPTQATAQNLPQNVELKVDDGVFENNQTVQSLEQLSVGDEIIVEADKAAMSNAWKAESILKADDSQSGVSNAATGVTGTAGSGMDSTQYQDQRKTNTTNTYR